MKKLEAIVRANKLDAVIDGLETVGYPGVTITDVKGHGKQKGLEQHWRGNAYTIRFIPKVKIEVVVMDEDVGRTVDIIMRKARTGAIGDGKVFVTEVADAIRVRTGETGDRAI